MILIMIFISSGNFIFFIINIFRVDS
jgi:hypothetical protein